jgi:hypothetical protein
MIMKAFVMFLTLFAACLASTVSYAGDTAPPYEAEKNYVCPDCGWTPWDEGGMNREGTYEPLVGGLRIANHGYDCEGTAARRSQAATVQLASQESAAERNDGRKLFRRAALRSTLRLKMVTTRDAKEREALQRVIRDPELFDALLDGLTTEYESVHGGAVQDFMAWLKENWSTVLKVILSLITLLEDGQTQADAATPFTLASYSPLPSCNVDGTGCPADSGGNSCPASCGCAPAAPCGRVGDRYRPARLLGAVVARLPAARAQAARLGGRVLRLRPGLMGRGCCGS